MVGTRVNLRDDENNAIIDFLHRNNNTIRLYGQIYHTRDTCDVQFTYSISALYIMYKHIETKLLFFFLLESSISQNTWQISINMVGTSKWKYGGKQFPSVPGFFFNGNRPRSPSQYTNLPNTPTSVQLSIVKEDTFII